MAKSALKPAERFKVSIAATLCLIAVAYGAPAEAGKGKAKGIKGAAESNESTATKGDTESWLTSKLNEWSRYKGSGYEGWNTTFKVSDCQFEVQHKATISVNWRESVQNVQTFDRMSDWSTVNLSVEGPVVTIRLENGADSYTCSKDVTSHSVEGVKYSTEECRKPDYERSRYRIDLDDQKHAERVGKALTHLIKLCGGKAVKEPF